MGDTSLYISRYHFGRCVRDRALCVSKPQDEGVKMVRHSCYDRDGDLLYMEDALSVSGCSAYDLLLQEFTIQTAYILKKGLRLCEWCESDQ